MPPNRKVDDRLTIGLGALAPEDLSELAQNRYNTVVDFRCPDEANPIAPADEARLAHDVGLAYVNLPVSGRTMGSDVVDRFRRTLAEAEGPVFVHCSAGGRAATVAVSGLLAEQGLSGEQAARRFEELGLPGSAEFVRAYVEQARWTRS